MANNGAISKFLLTPLREGRQKRIMCNTRYITFLLTPLREGRLSLTGTASQNLYFYSRPCGRGDFTVCAPARRARLFLLTPLREGRQQFSTSPS